MRHALLAGLAFALIAAPSHAGPRNWDQAWDVGAAPDVHVRTDDAHVRIHAGPAGKVTAHVEYEIKRWGLIMGTSQPAVVFERKNDEIWITLHDPSCIGVVGGVNERFSVDVTVPQGVRLAVRTGDGATDCDPLTGRFQFETGDGAIRAHGLSGDIIVSSGDGRVILHADHLRCVLDAEPLEAEGVTAPELVFEPRLVADENDAREPLAHRRHRAFHLGSRRVIAPHRVDGDGFHGARA